MKRQKFCRAVFFALLASLVFGTLAVAQTPFVEFGVVRQKCSVCHRMDNQGRVEVIEETLGIDLPLPPELAAVRDKEVLSDSISGDFAVLRSLLLAALP